MKKELFTKAQETAIVNAIKEAETNTSGEIRVHIEPKVKGDDTFKRATEVFNELNMHQTEARNGVLFYLAFDDKQFAILGDKGIDEKVPSNFWESTKNEVINQFKNNNFSEGLVNGILEAGKQLKEFFPYQSDDVNELSDEISKG